LKLTQLMPAVSVTLSAQPTQTGRQADKQAAIHVTTAALKHKQLMPANLMHPCQHDLTKDRQTY
jgi:hypothetical protein